jgi:hypothetical protein
MNEVRPKWAACIVYYQDQESLSNLLDSLQIKLAPKVYLIEKAAELIK